MTGQPDDPIDWSLTTWKGSRLQQHREFHALPFARKLELIEEMCEQIAQMIASRQRRGLPYIDPFTGDAVAPAPIADAVVREDPPGPEKRG
jgi:hypothetical protein